MPITGLQHIDLAVQDLERSLAFYTDLFGPIGAEEAFRYPTYRGSEEVVYLRFGSNYLGLRQADGGEHHYYDVGVEHIAVFVDSKEEVDATYERAVELGARIHFPPEWDRDEAEYWAFFFFDPDGIRIEVAHWPLEPL